MENEQIVLVGYDHKNTPVEFRDKISLTSDKIISFTKAVGKNNDNVREIAVVSTCNRTEFYLVASKPEALMCWLSWQYRYNKQFSFPYQAPKPNILYNQKAVEHLFAVSSGLESLILGEDQILGQVKESYNLLLSSGYKFPLLNKLFEQAIVAGKAVRTQTTLCQGAVSIGLAAVELARKIFRSFEKHRILLIGAGETSELVAKHFASLGAKQFIIANRTREKSEILAEKFGGKVISLDQIPMALSEVNVVVTATNSPTYLVGYEETKKILKLRSGPLLMVDISTPRNINPGIKDLSQDIFLYNIDDLRNVITNNIEKRKGQIPEAQSIIDYYADNYLKWRRSLNVTPTIKAVIRYFEDIRDKELEKFSNKVSAEEYQNLEKLANGIIKKIQHQPVVALQKMARKQQLDISKLHLISEIYSER
ncbi:glutamyl-tRNA reductase [Candidatus Uabimicrobium amorphum]|uniref:Glutamyl-tRNA reductase n=1 Tax=Uabimicrobium amorphum TaxID=2596890 RepID=A0A5S9F144_UABAM|nr:glutamyl-tRNA reductase [Candidatus Uabimicrobium amorphum]BBM82022.1 glutamyl-tRNA reductase [Candidatus Uabimicrobium amorphum]